MQAARDSLLQSHLFGEQLPELDGDLFPANGLTGGLGGPGRKGRPIGVFVADDARQKSHQGVIPLGDPEVPDRWLVEPHDALDVRQHLVR